MTLWALEPVKYCERRAEGFGGHDAEIEVHAAPQASGELGLAAGLDLGQAGVGGHAVHHHRGIAGDGQEVEVAHGIASAAIAAGGLDLLDGRTALHVGEDLPHQVVGLGPQHPLVGLGGECQPGQDRFFGLGPETFEFADLVGLAGCAQIRRAW